MLVLVRKERHAGDAWFAAKSYLGGLPKLGATPWPKDETGKPLYFMGQLDLADIDRASGGQSALPKSGALAFFIGGKKFGRILHLPQAGDAFTPPPDGRAAAQDVGGDALIDRTKTHGPTEFPFWPVEFRAIDPVVRHVQGDYETHEAADEAQSQAIAALFGSRNSDFSMQQACEKAGLSEIPLYWHSALMFAERVPAMLDKVADAKARGQGYVETSGARLAALDAGSPPPQGQGPWSDRDKDKTNAENWMATGRKIIAEAETYEAAVEDYLARVKAAIPDIDPWRPVTANDAAKLNALFNEARSKTLQEYARFVLPNRWRDYAGDTVRIMAAGPEEAYTRLPKALRVHINTACRLPVNRAHLMFGLGDNVQDNPNFEMPDRRMVLQLTYDDMLFWGFGDNGVYQFWIPVSALQAGDFSEAEATFECH